MKSHELLEVIGEVQDSYLLDAKAPKKKSTPMWVKWAATAACFVLILGLGIGCFNLLKRNIIPSGETQQNPTRPGAVMQNPTQQDIDETNPNYEVEYPLVSIDSVEEYNKFLDEKPSDQKYISYSMLREIGEFNRVTFLSNTKADDYSHYMYELCDASGYTLYLYVKAGQSEDSEKMVSEENVDPHDLRKLNDKSSGAYVCEGYEYRYVNGELLSIRWENEAYSFVLSGESMLSNYPEACNTILGSLLSVDTISVATINLQKIVLE